MSIFLKMVQNILNTTFDRFDTSTVEKAKKRVIDTVGCAISGASAPGCASVRNLVKEWGGKPESTILAYGGKIPAHNAAMINSIMARSYDFEPVGPYVDGKNTPGHISGTTVLTALAMAEKLNLGGKDLLTALIVGDDMAARINASSMFSLDQGWDCTGTANMFGATAVAGRLAGLNERQLQNAFGIVVNQLSGTMQNIFDGAHSFKLPQGLAARAGIFSSALAAEGFTGVSDPLFSRHGYFSLYCNSFDAEPLIKDLGNTFYADNTFKPYPCCRANHAAIDCALHLASIDHVVPDAIVEVNVIVPKIQYDFAVGQPFIIREVPQMDAAFSIQYNVATAIVKRSVRLEHFTEETIKDPDIGKMIEKVKLQRSSNDENFLAAKILIRLKNGTLHEKAVDIPKGDDLFTPLSDDEIREKFIANMSFVKTVDQKNGSTIYDILKNLETVNNLKELVGLLA